MKFSMPRDELSSLVGGLQAIVSQRSPMPLLSNILMEAEGSTLTLTATDLTVGVQCTRNAKVIEPGSITVPAKRFSQLMKEITASYVEISSNAREMCQVNAESSVFRIPGMAKADFPVLPNMTGAPSILIRQRDLKRGLFHTSFAIAKEESRFVLMGLFMRVTQDHVLLASTDGKRLSRSEMDAQTNEVRSFECVLPAKVVVELQNSLTDTDENVLVYLLQDKVAFSFGGRLVMTKLLAGEFPNAESVIPQTVSHVIAIHREEVYSLLRQVMLFVDENKPSVQLAFSDNALQIAANAVDIGDGTTSMAVTYAGPALTIAFNPTFFLDVLRHTIGEYIYMGVRDPFNPVMFSDVEFDSALTAYPSPLFIILPLRPATK